MPMTLHQIIEAYCPEIDKLVCTSSGITYQAMFLEPDLNAIESDAKLEHLHEIHRAYVLGIIERAHLSCVTSLARGSRWLTASGQMADAENILAFSAALRGFLEGAADAFDLLEKLPPTIAKSFKYILVVLHSPDVMSNGFVGFGELENLLIHFTYAKRQTKGANPLPQHTNKSNADYIRNIERFGVPGASALYSELCELTHPASPSVLCFVDQSRNRLTFNPNRDKEQIEAMLSRHQETILKLAQYSINPALITLSFLNRLNPILPAMPDSAMSSVGNTSKLLKEMDAFIDDYARGVFDPVAILQELTH